MSFSSTKIAHAGRRIGYYIDLKNINVKEHFSAMYSIDPLYVVTTNNIYLNPYHCVHDRTMKRWSERTDPFWWSCVAFLKTSKKRVVRSHVARKGRMALVESLKKQGWASDGSRLPDSKQEADLTGTLQLIPSASAIQASHAELVEQTDTLLESIIKISAKNKSKPDGKASGKGPSKKMKAPAKPVQHASAPSPNISQVNVPTFQIRRIGRN